MGTDKRNAGVICCLCRDPVLPSGWCDACQTWPINITPRRWDERGHLVDPDGFCRACGDYVLTKLDPRPGEWVDTRIVPRLLHREENLRRWKALGASLDAKTINAQLKHRDLQAEKAKILDDERKRHERDREEVPF